MSIFYAFFLFSIVSCYESTCDKTYQNVSITCNFEIYETGFHRNLEIKVRITSESDLINEQNVLIEETLPSSVFIDPFQTSLAKGSVPFDILLPPYTDVEATSEHATAMPILVYSKLNFSNHEANLHFIFPIHIRYHKPSISPFTSFALNQPKIYLNESSSCHHRNLSTCHWCSLPIVMNSSDIIIKVPVGQVEYANLVTWVTSSVISLGFVYLILIIMRKNYKK